MPFLIGGLLIPFIALIGAGFAVAFLAAFDWPPFGARWHFEVATIAVVFATLFAAPVTLGVLPVGYRMLARSTALNISRIAFLGMVGAFLSVAAFVFEESVRLGLDAGFIRGMCIVGFFASLVGLAVGFVFAIVMRWIRPEDWIPARSGH